MEEVDDGEEKGNKENTPSNSLYFLSKSTIFNYSANNRYGHVFRLF